MHPNEVTHYLKRTDYRGADGRYAVPIGRCAAGTIFAEMRGKWLCEPAPMATATTDQKLANTSGWSAIQTWNAPGSWEQTHWPCITLRDCQVETLAPVFVDGGVKEIIPDGLWEGHEVPWFKEPGVMVPVRIDWVRQRLTTAQVFTSRNDYIAGTVNSGDSGVPRFVQVDPETIAFLGHEITALGTGSNGILYRDLLLTAQADYPDLTWEEVGPGAVVPAATTVDTTDEPETAAASETATEPKTAGPTLTLVRTILFYDDGSTWEMEAPIHP